MFARYAAIVKNLRGVVVFNLDESGVWDSIVWLVQRFRYRNLGLTPTLVQRYRAILRDYLNGNPFRELVYPIEGLRGLDNILKQLLDVPLEVAEGLMFASIYISPLILVGKTYQAGIEDNANTTIRVCKDKKMDLKQWKLHLRIADYTIVDFYEKNIEENLEVLEAVIKGNVNTSKIREIIEKRLERVKRDTKRYWRIKCSNGTPFLYYVDPLIKIIDAIASGRLDPYILKIDYAAGLSIIPVIYVPSNMK